MTFASLIFTFLFYLNHLSFLAIGKSTKSDDSVKIKMMSDENYKNLPFVISSIRTKVFISGIFLFFMFYTIDYDGFIYDLDLDDVGYNLDYFFSSFALSIFSCVPFLHQLSFHSKLFRNSPLIQMLSSSNAFRNVDYLIKIPEEYKLLILHYAIINSNKDLAVNLLSLIKDVDRKYFYFDGKNNLPSNDIFTNIIYDYLFNYREPSSESEIKMALELGLKPNKECMKIIQEYQVKHLQRISEQLGVKNSNIILTQKQQAIYNLFEQALLFDNIYEVKESDVPDFLKSKVA